MYRQSVSSSNIADIGYDVNTHILEVGFLNGSVYQYSGVPLNIYNDLMHASSHGSYLANYVKGRYPYQKIY